MAKKSAQEIYSVLRTIALVSFLTTLGSCCACLGSGETEYGPEEFYQKPGGEIGYGARSYTSSDQVLVYFSVISGIVFLVSGIGASLYHGETPEGRMQMEHRVQAQIDKERRGK